MGISSVGQKHCWKVIKNWMALTDIFLCLDGHICRHFWKSLKVLLISHWSFALKLCSLPTLVWKAVKSCERLAEGGRVGEMEREAGKVSCINTIKDAHCAAMSVFHKRTAGQRYYCVCCCCCCCCLGVLSCSIWCCLSLTLPWSAPASTEVAKSPTWRQWQQRGCKRTGTTFLQACSSSLHADLYIVLSLACSLPAPQFCTCLCVYK